LKSISASFIIQSDGTQFGSSSSAAALQSLKQTFLIFDMVILVVFLASLFVHKMIGVELIFSFQVITLVHSLNSHYTATYGLFHVLSLLNANPLYIVGFQNNVNTVQQNIAFSQSNQHFSFEVIAGVCLAFLCGFGVLNMMNAHFLLS
jgi:hypothetical protein